MTWVTQGLVQPFGVGLAFIDYPPIVAPAAGANKALTVGGENYVRVLAARATFTPDANAASRLVSLDFINGRAQTVVRNAGAVLFAAASGAQAFEWSLNRTVAEWNTGTPVFIPLAPLFLEPGFTVQFTADSIQVGDTFTNLSLVLERWPTGPRGEPVGVTAPPSDD